MKTIELGGDFTLHTPDDYEKMSLSDGITAASWVAELRTRAKTTGVLHRVATDSYCCLGVIQVMAGLACGDRVCLEEDHPAFYTLSREGDFPRGVTALRYEGMYTSLAGINDACAGWGPVIAAIEALYI
jgi:hypothetical protein